ncbi:hypothetical protein GPY51_01065 [Photorhabdus laumondii subsp. laumondii]|uniref:Photorhabdus luminescens subsp. laumondii TTO1 complete genome segment 10/17 n=3 Tax=Photorhabdus TaxID=29487 RepID=Q7N3H6_PHOLL|nr:MULTISPECIES: hypothetical protein [Photorhabdus]RAW76814.1 hypothetical protein CKY14_00715 [Photorhabdus sp. S14-60]AWK42464.1 hypothetical protein A4R40_13650 [Photorhabdus laumondii subsp. laumondii]AXG43314.1 hypothetical protein PluDJC_14370 [Photorhabdus laumondii subsp. laumondii]AXG47786.1 hypothetical protein PluTT01m_14060 [Photorhabdus laumondii subsp. laumondii]KTL63529.1 aminopeptidase [Photorhabdus laumondii subsp. laumondii]
MVKIADYPQMKNYAWYLAEDIELTDRDALAFYERNWKYIEEDKLGLQERQLIERLIHEQGNGFLNV